MVAMGPAFFFVESASVDRHGWTELGWMLRSCACGGLIASSEGQRRFISVSTFVAQDSNTVSVGITVQLPRSISAMSC
jgi:hypothetical protein